MLCATCYVMTRRPVPVLLTAGIRVVAVEDVVDKR